jgi:hypothetical protein
MTEKEKFNKARADQLLADRGLAAPDSSAGDAKPRVKILTKAQKKKLQSKLNFYNI